jgi:hypothetical protein
MATESNGSSTRPSRSLTVPSRMFAEEFLAHLAEQDEPETAAEAEAAGPRHLEPDPQGGWAVLPEGESLAAGDVPEATFLRREMAEIAAAVLPGTARRLRSGSATIRANAASRCSSTAPWLATCGSSTRIWRRP